MKMSDNITLDQGAGGKEMDELVSRIKQKLSTGSWLFCDDDSAMNNDIVFTTDSFIVDPLFFPGGDIGKIAICGTINDLSVKGAVPIGISLALVIEEGFSIADLDKIINSIAKVSNETGVPVVTGDTKIMERGKLDKIMICTAGIGRTKLFLANSGAKAGQKVVVSGSIAQHGACLLAKRFGYTDIKSDCKPLLEDINAVRHLITCAKDPTRGGLASVLNEIAEKSSVKIIIEEDKVPITKEAAAICNITGIDKFSVASEGMFVCTTYNADKVLAILPDARVIGNIEEGSCVFVKTSVGTRKLNIPSGKLIPRIC